VKTQGRGREGVGMALLIKERKKERKKERMGEREKWHRGREELK
jgi:hypothetical protein